MSRRNLSYFFIRLPPETFLLNQEPTGNRP